MISAHLVIAGYGFSLQVGGVDFTMGDHTILSWSIIRNHQVWRGERHSRYAHGGYHYRCIKDGKDVENISFQSPVVSHLR